MVVKARGKKVNVKEVVQVRKQGGKGIFGKIIVMSVSKVSRKSVSPGVIRPFEVDCSQANIVRNTIIPQLQGQVAKRFRPSPAFMINIAYGGDIVASDKERDRNIIGKESFNAKKNGCKFQEIDM